MAWLVYFCNGVAVQSSDVLSRAERINQVLVECQTKEEIMSVFAKWRLFQKMATGVLVVFMGLMLFVTVYAHMRPSGSTRQDMSQAQLMRKEALQKSQNPVVDKESP